MSKATEYLEEHEFVKNSHGVYKYTSDDGVHGINLEAILEDFIELKPICLNPRNERDSCDRTVPVKECEGCSHHAQQTIIKN